MALNFPNTPNDGDTYDNFYYDATAGIWRRQLTVTDLSDLDTKPINDLDDVDATSPNDNDILRYNSGTGNWETEQIPDPNLSSLNDVGLSSPEDGEVLKYDGTNWANSPVAINTDGDPGGKIFVGAIDPDTSYTLEPGDVWIEVPS